VRVLGCRLVEDWTQPPQLRESELIGLMDKVT
jgi:hypothetical protein